MKLQIDYSDLDALRLRMGAAEVAWSDDTGLSERERILRDLNEGKEIDLSDVRPDAGGLLTHKGEQVILYIKDTQQSLQHILEDPDGAKKFHLAECRTLETMRNHNRFERYVVTNRTDGKFPVFWKDKRSGESGEAEVPLRVCKNCLTKLNWEGYSDKPARKKEIYSAFMLDDFFATFSTFFRGRPSHTDKTAPLPGYAKNWQKLSREYRQSKGWICEQCGVNLSEHRRLLHVHHVNGVTRDNEDKNLQALCLLCHRAQPAHGRMHVSDANRELIQKLRREQGIGTQ